MITFQVPPGIGDIGWVYSRVKDLVDAGKVVGFSIAANLPQRSHGFVNLLPGIKNLGYGWYYNVKHVIPFDWDLSILDDGEYPICINPWLEAGKRIELAFPKQKMHYHYDLNIDAFAAQYALSLVKRLDVKTKIVVYCSSHLHRPNFGLWEVDGWLEFLGYVHESIPDVGFIFVGASFDNKTAEVYQEAVKRYKCLNCMGTDIDTTLSILKQTDYFFAFPSGLGTMCDVLNIPCMMWYWSNIMNDGLQDAYADPDNLATKVHLVIPYLSPRSSFLYFLDHGKQWVKGLQ